MEPRELAEIVKEAVDGYNDASLPFDTHWGHGDADFFIETDDEGTFLVTVSKVAE